MLIYYPEFHEFMAVVEASSSVSVPLVAIFHPTWKRNHQNSLNQFINSVLKNSREIFLISVNGSDDAAEYLIEEIGMTSPPVLVIYLRSRIVVCRPISEIDKVFEAQIIYSLLLQQVRPIREVIDPASLLSTIVRGSSGTIKIYIAGDKSKVGKSSICLGLLSELLKYGFQSSDLAYIKPITQCEAEQPVAIFCKQNSIAYRGIGPVVFYQGFTRAFLNKETESSENLLKQVVDAVNEISTGKRVVLVDGVGYPSVGSIVNLSNATVAKALSSPVLLVGKPGVGDAVDSYNLNATYFSSNGVKILGGVFNKFQSEGFYNLEDCRSSITSYFHQYNPSHRLYGFIPEVSRNTISPIAPSHDSSSSMEIVDSTTSESKSADADESTQSNNPFVSNYLNVFHHSFDLPALIKDLFFSNISTDNLLDLSPVVRSFSEMKSSQKSSPSRLSTLSLIIGQNENRRTSLTTEMDSPLNTFSQTVSRKRSREEVEREASSKGAKIG